MKRTYKFRLYPTTQQQTTLTQWLNTCRLLYNNSLAERKDAWQTHKQSFTNLTETQIKTAYSK
ncbi:MAG: helix-turn-helix domain-containing protein [Promethearchaeota archaeon]